MKFGLIAATSGIVREGLLAVLRAIRGIEVLDPVDDGSAALDILNSRPVDLIILDSSLTDAVLWATVTQIKDCHPATRCLVLIEEPEQQQNFTAVGAAVLIKGYTAVALSNKIKELLVLRRCKGLTDRC